jgi:hypothetical protein
MNQLNLFSRRRSPITPPNIGDRIRATDNLRNLTREGVFVREVEWLGATFWEVESGEKFLPLTCEIIKNENP